LQKPAAVVVMTAIAVFVHPVKLREQPVQERRGPVAAVLHESRGTVMEQDRASSTALLTFKDFFSCKNIIDFLPGQLADRWQRVEALRRIAQLKCSGKAGTPNLLPLEIPGSRCICQGRRVMV
jgi:hypothetical protein